MNIFHDECDDLCAPRMTMSASTVNKDSWMERMCKKWNGGPDVVDQSVLDAADELLLEAVHAFVEAHGGVPERVGGVDLVHVSTRKFYVLVHCEGFAPPLPGAPANG